MNLVSIFILTNLTILGTFVDNSYTTITCADEIIGDRPIYRSIETDLNMDRLVEEVIIYEGLPGTYDNVSPLFLAILSRDTQGNCYLLFERKLTSSQPQQQDIHTLEVREITGEGLAEIHLAYDTQGTDSRNSFARQYIFGNVNDKWQEIFSGQECLAYHYFEFRENPGGMALDIYVEDDPYCLPPLVSDYAGHTIYRWNGERYRVYERGNTHSFSDLKLSPSFTVVCSLISCLLLLVSLVLGAWWIRKNSKNSASIMTFSQNSLIDTYLDNGRPTAYHTQ